MAKNRNWNYREWLESDGIIPKTGQWFPTEVYTSGGWKSLEKVYLFAKEQFNDKTGCFFNVQPNKIYYLNYDCDHFRITGAMDPNINKRNYYKFIASFINDSIK